jgi:hypothetical protein
LVRIPEIVESRVYELLQRDPGIAIPIGDPEQFVFIEHMEFAQPHQPIFVHVREVENLDNPMVKFFTINLAIVIRVSSGVCRARIMRRRNFVCPGETRRKQRQRQNYGRGENHCESPLRSDRARF